MHVSHLVSQEESLQEPLATRQTLSIADDMEVFEIRPVYHTQRQRKWNCCLENMSYLGRIIAGGNKSSLACFQSVVYKCRRCRNPERRFLIGVHSLSWQTRSDGECWRPNKLLGLIVSGFLPHAGQVIFISTEWMGYGIQGNDENYYQQKVTPLFLYQPKEWCTYRIIPNDCRRSFIWASTSSETRGARQSRACIHLIRPK